MKKKLLCFGMATALLFVLWLVRPGSEPGFLPLPTPGAKSDAGVIPTASKNDSRTASQPTDDKTTSATQLASAGTLSESYRLRQPDQDRIVTIDNRQYPLRTYEPLALPNDPQANQWWVGNAQLEQAWEIPRGNHGTLLAIIDTGFGLQHEEFTDRWYVSPGESGAATAELPSALNCTDRSLPLTASCNLIDDDEDTVVDNESGAAAYQNSSRLNCTDQLKPLAKSCNRIDDDGNGYVDDVNGWDFNNYDNSPQAGELNPAGTGTTHGTMVAGVAAATGNNAKGIAGVDWGTKILPLQALDDNSYGNTLTVGRAIRYAVAQGADVISLSLGSGLPDAYVEEAVRAAIAAGIVVVAAAGNDGCDCMLYPARYPEVVAVGALNTSSQRASFSSWGSNLDIVAPGSQIGTPTWQVANGVSTYASNVAGTSFAAPMVGGLMTRLLSQQPGATPLQLIAALTENTNRLALPPAVPHDATLGFGALNAAAASQRMATPRASPQLYAFEPVSKGNYLSSAGAHAEAPGAYLAYQCEAGSIGSTPVYELIKANSTFFTVSKAENNIAKNAGYASTAFAHACLQQPHDTAVPIPWD